MGESDRGVMYRYGGEVLEGDAVKVRYVKTQPDGEVDSGLMPATVQMVNFGAVLVLREDGWSVWAEAKGLRLISRKGGSKSARLGSPNQCE